MVQRDARNTRDLRMDYVILAFPVALALPIAIAMLLGEAYRWVKLSELRETNSQGSVASRRLHQTALKSGVCGSDMINMLLLEHVQLVSKLGNTTSFKVLIVL